MLDAFEKGGDFHSRTAIGMYDNIARAVEEGSVLLEWYANFFIVSFILNLLMYLLIFRDSVANGPPPAPLLKDVFRTERNRAKVLNFSIAYGKTQHGLAADWGLSVKEGNYSLPPVLGWLVQFSLLQLKSNVMFKFFAAKGILEKWYQDRPEVREWQEKMKQIAMDHSKFRDDLDTHFEQFRFYLLYYFSQQSSPEH